MRCPIYLRFYDENKSVKFKLYFFLSAYLFWCMQSFICLQGYMHAYMRRLSNNNTKKNTWPSFYCLHLHPCFYSFVKSNLVTMRTPAASQAPLKLPPTPTRPFHSSSITAPANKQTSGASVCGSFSHRRSHAFRLACCHMADSSIDNDFPLVVSSGFFPCRWSDYPFMRHSLTD